MGVRKFIEEQELIDTSLEELTEQKTGAEIARELGISRQAVSNTLKRGLEKTFKTLKKENKDMDAFEVAIGMAEGLQVEDHNKFFRLFPPAIRKEIEEAGKKRMTHLK